MIFSSSFDFGFPPPLDVPQAERAKMKLSVKISSSFFIAYALLKISYSYRRKVIKIVPPIIRFFDQQQLNG